MSDLPFRVRLKDGKVYTLATNHKVNAPPKVYDYGLDALIISQSHYQKRNGSWSGGGPFLQFTQNYKHDPLTLPMDQIARKVSTFPWLKGTRMIVPSSGFNSNPTPDYASLPLPGTLAELIPWGTKGWHQAKPGTPGVDLLVGIGELAREGIPSLPGRLLNRLRNFRSMGSEYLNVQFGWMPLVSDIRKMYETYRTLDQRLAQIVRDNGHGIRRRRTLGNQTTTSVLSDATFPASTGGVYPSMSVGGYNGIVRQTVIRKTHERIWFAGRFRYYIPDIGTDQWRRRATRALFGLNPTPEVLWNLLPWSWLIDWFTNVGDVVANLSNHAAENLTADYAYVMRTKGTSTYTTCVPMWRGTTDREVNTIGYDSLSPGSASSMTTDEVTEKARISATPYGFGVTYDGLNNYQMSILAALGISRSRF